MSDALGTLPMVSPLAGSATAKCPFPQSEIQSVRVAVLMVTPDLSQALEALAAAFRSKADEYQGVIKFGRTQLQDVVPITLRQELRALVVTILEDVRSLARTADLLREVNIAAQQLEPVWKRMRHTASASSPRCRKSVI